MEITEVRVFLKDSPDKKLRAYATVTFDNVFVVRNIKIIQGTNGLFIAMPSRRIKQPCYKCSFKNEIRARYCNQCGVQLPVSSRISVEHHEDSNVHVQSEHKDIAHPITQTFRDCLQRKVLDAYEDENNRGQGEIESSFAAR